MNNTARHFNCARCRSQVFIYRSCDTGNRYCHECAPIARQEAKRRAAARYQASPQGRRNHAARQQRYRARLKNNVTHKASLKSLIRDLLCQKQKKVDEMEKPFIIPGSGAIIWHSYRNICSPFLRLDFLRRPVRLRCSSKLGF